MSPRSAACVVFTAHGIPVAMAGHGEYQSNEISKLDLTFRYRSPQELSYVADALDV